MKTSTSTIAGLVLLIVVIAGGVYLVSQRTANTAGQTATSTPPGNQSATVQTVTAPNGVGFTYDKPYGLATAPEQILAKSYIPPCQDFDYCLYRTGTDYAATNFESAGLGVKARADLTTQTACLSTQPEGYTNLHTVTYAGQGYATSVFSPIGDAGAGHYASGAEYRLWTGSACEQFDTRIGETQFANYPAGTKTQFSDADHANVMGELTGILHSVTVNGAPVSFPNP